MRSGLNSFNLKLTFTPTAIIVKRYDMHIDNNNTKEQTMFDDFDTQEQCEEYYTTDELMYSELCNEEEE